MKNKSAVKSRRKVGLRGKYTSNKVNILLLTLMILSLLAMGLSFVQVNKKQSQDITYKNIVAEMNVLALNITTESLKAIQGEQKSFDRLYNSQVRFEELISSLINGSRQFKLPATDRNNEALINSLKTVATHWKEAQEAIHKVLNSNRVIKTRAEGVIELKKNVPSLLELTEEISRDLRREDESKDHVYLSTRNMALIQRISATLDAISRNEHETALAADQFMRDSANFYESFYVMIEGSPVWKVDAVKDLQTIEKIKDSKKIFDKVVATIGKTLQNADVLFSAANATHYLDKYQHPFTDEITALSAQYTDAAENRVLSVPLSITFGVVSLILLIVMFMKNAKDRKRQLITEEANSRVVKDKSKRDEEAIMILLDEIGPLADGDFTNNLTVSEEITGAIADSVNMTVTSVREIIRKIRSSSMQVSSATEETKATAEHLQKASEEQARMIENAKSEVVEITNSIDVIAGHTKKSSEVALETVTLSKEGAKAVHDTINGMTNIREQIQETSKRVKRLGEVSQEVGDIVDMISNLADQTNILALNASIQAATAGEHGKGFAVVADEVQRLAEESANATKSISSIVRSIQSETHEAVQSMENTTSQVVAGSSVATKAGDSLESINKVADTLSDLIQQINEQASGQEAMTKKVNETMSAIAEITMQTSAGTKETTASISSITDLSVELQESVSHFILNKEFDHGKDEYGIE